MISRLSEYVPTMVNRMGNSTLIKLCKILKDELRVDQSIDGDSLICFDLGICDDEFQDLLLKVKERFGLDVPVPCHTPFSESNASVADLVRWIELLSDA